MFLLAFALYGAASLNPKSKENEKQRNYRKNFK